MKLKHTYFVALLFLLIQAGNSFAQTEYFVTVDRTTGEHTIIDNLPTVNFIVSNATTYDRNNERYVFCGIDFSGDYRLFCVDATTGSMISEPLIAETNVGEFHYDSSSDILYALKVSGGQMHVVSIDIPTATVTDLVLLPVVGFISSASYFDEANQIFGFHVGGELYQVNVITGAITILSSPFNLGGLHYDNANENLYGIQLVGGTTQIVEINEATGTPTPIITMPESGYSSVHTAFDEINQYYTYASPSFLYTVDVQTGSILWDPTFPLVLPGQNVIELHYDNNTGILYGLHWGEVVDIIDPPAPTVMNDTICVGEMGTLSVIGTGDFDWVVADDPTTVIESGNTLNISPEETTEYLVFNATDTLSATIVVIKTTADFVISNTSGCSPLLVQYNSTSTTSIGEISDLLWTFSDGTISTALNPSFSYNESGSFITTLEVTTDYGCIAEIEIESDVDVTPTPVAKFRFDPEHPTKSDEINFEDQSLNPQNWEWTFGDGEESIEQHPIHSYTENGTYEVTLKVSNGDCHDDFTQYIAMQEDLIFYIPNAFTPNSNGLNDHFAPVFTSGYDPYNYHLIIFNRWGNIVFESFDASVGWNGIYGGKEITSGTYIWQVEFRLKDSSEEQIHRGHFTLLK